MIFIDKILDLLFSYSYSTYKELNSMGSAPFKIAARKPMTPPGVSVDAMPAESLQGVTITKGNYQGDQCQYVTGAVYLNLDSQQYLTPEQKKRQIHHYKETRLDSSGDPIGSHGFTVRPKF